MSTTNLNLITFNKGVDLDQSFEDYRMNLSGPTDSNMTKIDDYFGSIVTLLPLILSQTNASFVPILASEDGFLANASGSITSASSTLNAISGSLAKIGSFSGSGQADFTSIPLSYTHLLMFGSTAVNYLTSPSANIGIDFNGDSGSSNYATLQLDRSGSTSGSYTETISTQQTGQIIIGKTNTNIADVMNAGLFMAIIPFYSGCASGSYLNKTAMGISAFPGYSTTGWQMLDIQGGTWLSGSSINRIRVFGSTNSTTRRDFHDSTIITLYGII